MNLEQRPADSQKRLLIALGLSFLLTLVYITFFAPKRPSPEEQAALAADAGAQAAAVTDAGAQAAAVAPAPSADGGELAAAPPPPAEAPPPRTVKLDRDPLLLEVSNEGGGLTRAELQGPKMREQLEIGIADGYARLFGKQLAPPPQMDMARPVAGQPLPLAVGIVGAAPFPDATRYAVEESPQGLVLTGRHGTWEVKKTFAWSQDARFQLAYSVEVKNVGAAPASGELAVHYARAVDPSREHKGSFFGGIGNESRSVCRTGDDLHSRLPSDDPPEEFKGAVGFFGVDQQYFLGALFPLEGAKDGRCVLTATPTGRSVAAFFPLSLGPGQSTTLRFGAFIGPKDLDLLPQVPSQSLVSAAGVATVSPVKLETTVDFGIWAVLCRVLVVVLKFFYGAVHSWGVAIILLTVMVKVVLLPLTHKAMVAAENMKKLQPKMEEIRKKYPDDRDKQNMETMKLYQEAKVNPLGGCLPLLVQLPVWGALFTTLRTSYDIYGEPFLAPLWLDLTYKDPMYLLPLALGVTMIITQRLQPQMMDPTQAKIMTYGMPVFFTVIMLNYPAGLALYIFTNNLLSILQQYLLKKWLQKRGVAAPPPTSGGKGAGKDEGKKKLASRKAATNE